MYIVRVLPLAAFVTVGLLTHAAEKRWPLRVYAKPARWALDGAAFAFGAATQAVFQRVLARTVYRLPAVPGFGWLSDTSHFVQRHVPWPVAFVVSAVVLDFLLYVGHRMLHTKVLWHTHALHHSVEHLYWFGGNRASPVHVSLQYVWGAFLGLLLPIDGGMPAVVLTTLLYVGIQHFNHANLRWRLGPLEWLFVVPRYHFVHHGADPKLNNSNFGFLLTIWDRAFGTYTNPDHAPENFALGLDYECELSRLFVGLPPSEKRPEPQLEGLKRGAH
jgi:sterol desaturase/sphingolipid hydroxylase (fatty acid hydroxylase superfamily)